MLPCYRPRIVAGFATAQMFRPSRVENISKKIPKKWLFVCLFVLLGVHITVEICRTIVQKKCTCVDQLL